MAGLALLPVPALCDEARGALGDSFYIAVGTFIVDTDTTLRLDGNAGERGIPIDWEKDFGDGDVNRFRFDGFWRFRRSAQATSTGVQLLAQRHRGHSMRNIEWGGDTFQANAHDRWQDQILDLRARVRVCVRARQELRTGGVPRRLHYPDYDATLEGNATATGTGGTAEAFIEKTGSVGAPLPVVGLRGTWMLSDNVLARCIRSVLH